MNAQFPALSAALLFLTPSFAQGTIYFNNRALPFVDAPVARPDGTGAGAGVTGQLVLVGAGGQLTPLFPTTTFRTFSPATAYYVNAVTVTVPGVRPLEPATIRMRAWEGASFETATVRGESNDVLIPRLGDPDPCPFIQCWETGYLTGLQAFTMTVPEPSFASFVILGVWMSRRAARKLSNTRKQQKTVPNT